MTTVNNQQISKLIPGTVVSMDEHLQVYPIRDFHDFTGDMEKVRLVEACLGLVQGTYTSSTQVIISKGRIIVDGHDVASSHWLENQIPELKVVPIGIAENVLQHTDEGIRWDTSTAYQRPHLEFPGDEEEVRSFLLGPVFTDVLREMGVSTIVLEVVKDLVYTMFKDRLGPAALHILRPAEIRYFSGQEVLLHFPSLKQVATGTYEVSGLSYVFSIIACIPKEDQSNFFKILEQKLIETVIDGVPNVG